MSEYPQTLMQMAGAKPAVPDLEQSVLVLIDYQKQYLSGATRLSGVDEALDAAEQLLDRCRVAEVPVVHVRHVGRPGGLFDPETDAADIIDQVGPLPDEQVITKALPNAFAGTDLQKVLTGTGASQLIVGGFMTHMCVSSTVRAGLDLGWNSFVVASSCATRDLPDPVNDGAVVNAREVHRAALAGLADRFATVMLGPGII